MLPRVGWVEHEHEHEYEYEDKDEWEEKPWGPTSSLRPCGSAC